MNKTYKYIFFDLDHTLWDYDANAQTTLEDLYKDYQLGSFGLTSVRSFIKHFMDVNEVLWADYNVGKIDKFYLRNQRFKLVFEAAGADMEEVSDELLRNFNKDFLLQCSTKEKLIDGAKAILDYLQPKYRMFIITNGFKEVQSTKLESGGIAQYFENVITSEKAGFKKPFAGIFYYAMKHCKADPEHSIMIGDNLQTDIKGARDYGIDQVFFNPQRLACHDDVSYQIQHLEELKEFL